MKTLEIEKMANMENSYWWHLGKKYLVKSLIEHHFDKSRSLNILEIGCGTGGLTQSLTQFGDVTGFDISSDAVEFCKNKGLKNIYVQDISKLDTAGYTKKYNLILALDVLEHLQEDVLAMQKVREMLDDRGLFFINVPAHKFLWSEHDEALHHKRRYTTFEITNKLIDHGFEITKKTLYFSIAS